MKSGANFKCSDCGKEAKTIARLLKQADDRLRALLYDEKLGKSA